MYKHDPDLKEIRLTLTGSGQSVNNHILIPKGFSGAVSVMVNGKPVDFDISRIEKSSYVDFRLSIPEIQDVVIRYE
jgi:hypothetical protein